MSKYCIVPKSKNDIFRLFADLDMTDAERENLEAAGIRHIEITPEEWRWEILLETQTLFAEDFLLRAAEVVRQKCKLKDVVFYQHVVSLSAAVEQNWKKLVCEAMKDSPAGKDLLLEAEHFTEGNTLIVKVMGGLAAELLDKLKIADKLQQTIEKFTGIRCDVKCQAMDEAHAPNTCDVDNKIYETEAYKVALDQKKNQKSVPTGKSDVKTKETKTAGAPAGEDFILGNNVSGDVQNIDDIRNETKDAVFVGSIIDVSGRELKSTNIIVFSFADDTNGVSCKAFLKDKDEYNAVLSALSKVVKDDGLVKIKGKFAYDSFLNDMGMMVNSIQKTKKAERMDNAPEKRVELHAHTQMSALDAVVSPKKLIKTAAKWGWDAIAITDHGVIQAYPEAMETVEKLDIKVIYGMEGYLVGDDLEQKRANHIIILAKNLIGLQNLYRLVSISHLRTLYVKRKQPRIPKKLLAEYREGLIIGSACEAGELVRAIVAHQSEEELLRIASFYDYLEIQPIGNNAFLKRSDEFPDIQTDEDLKTINLKVADLAKKLGKMLIATCDVHFLNPEDSIYRAVIMKGNGFSDADQQPPLYLRTTEEMLAEFDYLGEEEAYAAVVTNPRKISEMVEKFKPIPDELYSPKIPGADEEITNMAYAKAHDMYGEVLPKIVQDRIDLELKPIIAHGFSVLYLIAHKLVKKSNLDGYLVGSRGSVGSSFIATMTDITEVNPLPPHWRCPNCKHSKFVTDGSYSSGFDLPDLDCPVCGTPMIKDGHEIPFAVFLGFDGDKVPDIDLNFSGVYQPVAHKYTEILFGKDNVYKAGQIQTVADKTAYGYVKHFFEEKGIKKRDAYVEHIVKGCLGTKRTTGQHPAGIMVVPRDMDVHFFSPIQRPANDPEVETITTHFDYHSISSRLVKLDILGHDDPTMIKMLEDLTHRDPKTIPFDDKATLSLFQKTVALGLTPEELGANSGTFGIPEFRTSFTRQMIDDTHPDCFSDLVRISGFSHGTDVWLGNAQDLIRSGKTTLKNAISARDDIMVYLIHKGVEPLLSFKTMENVRKGKGIAPEVVEKLRASNVPEWYIESCQKIKYLFPRAHATAYVMMAYRIAYCKVHYPLAFYAAYFSIRADAFDVNIISKGKEEIKRQLEAIIAIDKPSQKEKDLLIVLQLAWEMYLRGFYVEKIDLYKSDAVKFIIHENSLLPPLNSLNGFGNVAAKSLVEARKNGPFTSIADIKKRTSASQTNIEQLREHGCLAGMQESDQMELFA